MTTGSGVEFVPVVALRKLRVLGRTRNHLPALCHTLPPSAGVDGLLGLDFLRHRELVINFRTGNIKVR